MADKAESKSLVGYTAIKQLTIAELREQFEEYHKEYNYKFKPDKKGCYLNKIPNMLFLSWLKCARANNIIKG